MSTITSLSVFLLVALNLHNVGIEGLRLPQKTQLLPSYCHLCVDPQQKQFSFLGSRRQVEGLQGSKFELNISYVHVNYFASVIPTTWNVARKDCSEIFGPSASLLSLETPDELDFLLERIQSGGVSALSYWTSGKYWKNEKRWKWGNNGDSSLPRDIPWAKGWPKVSSLSPQARVTLLLPSHEGNNLETQFTGDLARAICEVRVATSQTEDACGALEDLRVEYKVHLQDLGWERSWHSEGEEAGTTGQSRRLEAIKLRLRGAFPSIGVSYSGHVQSIGWQEWVKEGEVPGTTGESRRLEALRIRLNGVNGTWVSVHYRVHVEGTGWGGWVSDGDIAGSVGESRRIEAVQIKTTNNACRQ